METKLAIFEQKEIRKVWDSETWDWFFSIVDIIWALTESENPRNYWKVLKNRLNKEWSQLVTNCNQLKLMSSDWKKYLTDVWNTQTILRLIQSVPSKKAEPFKMWLAKVGDERINEISDPELAIERAISNYRKKWYDEAWISQRLKSIDIRKELTSEWNQRWIKQWLEYAILTNEILEGWSGMKTSEYKDFKWLKKESLKDNMTNLELALNILAEATTTEIIKSDDSIWFEEVKVSSKKWGKIIWETRKNIENEIWKSIISNKNFLKEDNKNKLK